MSINIVLLGAPGSGKGTQSKKIIREYGVPQISMGDILRQKKNEASNLGKQLAEIMASGALVPDDVVIDIIRDRIQLDDCNDGFILDGFPRTVAQADALDQLLEEIEKPLSAVISLDVPSDKLLVRLTGRRVCSACGKEFHLEFAPPKESGVCDDCSGDLVQRADDTEETIRNRLVVFTEQTAPLVEYYNRKNILKPLDGDRDADAIFGVIQQILDGK